MKQLLITIAAVVLMGCGKTQNLGPKMENQLVKTVSESSQSKINTGKVLSCCNSIHEAAANGKIDAVKAHLNGGADVNERDSEGLTPLHLVEKKEIAELLIAKGAELNPIDNFFEYTPLDFMEGEVDQDTINFLRKHGGKRGQELKAEGK
jgi:ankyrin repeat protein